MIEFVMQDSREVISKKTCALELKRKALESETQPPRSGLVQPVIDGTETAPVFPKIR
jgi:hypothetical protein